MSRAWSLAALLALLQPAACGDQDRGYGEPIASRVAEQNALSAVDNATLLDSSSSNDAPLLALNGISANLSVMFDAKLQAQAPTYASTSARATSHAVDDSCVIVTDSEITYDACDFGGSTVDGTVRATQDSVTVDLDLSVQEPDRGLRSEQSITGTLVLTESQVTGSLDFDTAIDTDDASLSANIFCDFDVVLDQGCPVAGALETHLATHAQSAGTNTRHSVWVKADFGPECGDVVIR